MLIEVQVISFSPSTEIAVAIVMGEFRDFNATVQDVAS